MRSVLAFSAVLIGCASSSSSSNEGPACTLQGTWAVHYNRDSQNPGDCANEPDAFDDIVTVSQSSPSTVTLQFGGATGGCVAELDGCAVTNKCDHASNGVINGTRQDSWRFTDKATMGGSSFFTVSSSRGECLYNAVASGTRK